MMLLHDKISPLIESQFPSFYREEGPTFVLFVEEYYKWLETTGNPLYHSRHLLDYADIDTTLDEFLPHFQTKFIPNTPTANIQNQRDLIKHSADIYRTRGTIQSLRLVFQMLYDEAIDVYYPGDDILKPSDGKWVSPKYLEVTLTDRTRSFIGKDVTGVISGARGFVESIERRVHDGNKIDVVYLSNVVNNEETGSTFVAGEYITDNGTHDGCPTVIGSLRSIEITGAGSGFDVGQIVDVVSTLRGKQGRARVTEVGALTGEINYRLLDGGFGYTNNATIFGSNTKVTVSSNVITTVAFTAPDPTISSFNAYPSVVQPLANVAYTANTVAFQTGDLIVGVNTSNVVIATGIVLSTNNSGHMTVSPRTTTSISLDTIALPSSTGSFGVGELVYQTTSGANVAHGRVLLANSTTVVVDQRYGPFQTNTTLFSSNTGCTANATAVTTRAYTDLNFANASITKIYSNENASANATVSSTARMTIYGTIVGSNTSSVGIINPTVGGAASFNANTGVNGATEFISVLGPTYHKFANGDLVKYLVATGNTAISGLANNNNYYVVNTSNNTHLQLSSSFGGSAINITASATNESGHSLTATTTKTFRTGTNAYIHAAGNTSITAEAAVVSVGYPGGFQIGQITDTEVAYIGTTLIGGSNTALQPLLNLPLNAAVYGFPTSPTANLSSVVGSVLTQQAYTIGSILSLTNRNPGYLNTAKPYLTVNEPAIAAYAKPSRVNLTLDQSTAVGAYIGTTLIGGSNTALQPLLNLPLNAAVYGFPTSPTANLSSVVGSVLTQQAYTIGSILSLTNRNPGYLNTAKPYLTVNEPAIAAYAKPSRVNLTLDQSTAVGTFKPGELVQETISIPAVNAAFSSINGTFSTSTRELVRQVRSDGVTTYGEMYVVDLIGNTARIIVANTANTFDTSNTIVSVANSSVNTLPTAVNTLNVNVFAKGTILNITTVSGTVVPSELYLKQKSFQSFQTGSTVTGVESGSYATIVSVSGDPSASVLGNDANIDPQSDISAGTIKAVEIFDSGFFYSDGEVVSLVEDGNQITGSGVITVDSIGISSGFWRGDDGTLSSTKRVQDNEYYQEYSYEIRAGIDRTIYEPAVKSLTHVAGTKMFNKYSKTTESVVDVNGVSAYLGPQTTLTIDAWPAELIATIDNPNAYGTAPNDYFGAAVKLSGNYAVVSAYREDDPGGLESGKAYIFNVTTRALLTTLSNYNATGLSASDYFGRDVAIAGNYVVVGAYLEDATTTDNSGKVYVYSATLGTYLYTLSNPVTTGGNFGERVAAYGNYVAVAATAQDSYSGRVHVYNITTGALLYSLMNPNIIDSGGSDTFGVSVTIHGNYLIVGAPYEDFSSSVISVGAVYVFDVITGSLLYTLLDPNKRGTSTGDQFGVSVHASGNYLAVGANGEVSSDGIVYVYNILTGSLLYSVRNPNANPINTTDYFGSSVHIANNKLFVGAPQEWEDASNSASGKVYVFDIQTGKFIAVLNNPNWTGTPGNDNFGSFNTCMGSSGNYLWVGTPAEDDAVSNSGKVYVFDISTNVQLIDGAFIEQKVGGVTTASGYVTAFDPINKTISLTNTTGTFSASSALYIGTTQYGTITKVGKNI